MAVRQRPARGAPGQHFLRSSRLAAALVREAGVAAGDVVVEIGAGTGVLTRALVEAGAEVTALELDPALTARLRRRFAAARNVSVLEADAMRWSWPGVPFAVVSNLPFEGSGAILGRLLGDPGAGPERAEVIVQWELAAKYAALWPATLKGTYWRAWYDLSAAGRLARTAFSPPPGVDAGVLRAVRRTSPLIPTGEREAYRRFLVSAFGVRAPLRRVLSSSFSPLELKRLAPALGFAPDARARDLDARQWAELYAFARARSRL